MSQQLLPLTNLQDLHNLLQELKYPRKVLLNASDFSFVWGAVQPLSRECDEEGPRVVFLGCVIRNKDFPKLEDRPECVDLSTASEFNAKLHPPEQNAQTATQDDTAYKLKRWMEAQQAERDSAEYTKARYEQMIEEERKRLADSIVNFPDSLRRRIGQVFNG